MISRRISIDGHIYIIEILKDMQLVFSRQEYLTDPLWQNFDDNEQLNIFTFTNDTRHAIKVLNEVKSQVINIAMEEKIPFFTFKAYETRRAILYEKIIKRAIKSRNLPYKYFYYQGHFTVTLDKTIFK